MKTSANNSYLDLSESKSWNVAKDYSTTKIMKWLYMADEYEFISTFGVTDLLDEFSIDENTKSILRLRGLKWFNKTLLMIISNTLKLIKTKYRDNMLEYKKYLLQIEKILPKLQEESKIRNRDNQVTYSIDEEKFNSILKIMIEIKTEMIEPLNKSELIFTSIEDFDPKILKEKIISELVENG